jgi:asparagine synthetase B (glutamine-hydrolysing)
VAFSGGRDSSAVLALATRAARRHGLPDPVPVTERFPGLQDPEDDWQELTVRHLGLKEWIRKDGDVNSDLLGPASREFLRRYGVVWPATISANLGLAAVARGGVLLTGEGGDGVWATYRVRAARRLLKRRPSRAAISEGALAIAPRPLRSRLARKDINCSWLRPEARRLAETAIADEDGREPFHTYKAMLHDASTRAPILGRHNFKVIAADLGTRLEFPLVDNRFLGALAPVIGRKGFWNVAGILGALFTGILPEQTIKRETKSLFHNAYFGPASRAFAAEWDGTGVDHDLVDVDRLKSLWRQERPHSMTFMLFQSAWLPKQREAAAAGGRA